MNTDTLITALEYLGNSLDKFTCSTNISDVDAYGFIKIITADDILIISKEATDNWCVISKKDINKRVILQNIKLIKFLEELNPVNILYCFNEDDTLKVLWKR
jgi:hypothetical protein